MVPPGLRLESDCGPLVHIFAILSTGLILVLFLLLPSLLRNVVYVQTTMFAQLARKQHKLYVERGLLHLNINIVYSQLFKTLLEKTNWQYSVLLLTVHYLSASICRI